MEDVKHTGPLSKRWILFTKRQSSGLVGIWEGWLHGIAKRSPEFQTTIPPAFEKQGIGHSLPLKKIVPHIGQTWFLGCFL